MTEKLTGYCLIDYLADGGVMEPDTDPLSTLASAALTAAKTEPTVPDAAAADAKVSGETSWMTRENHCMSSAYEGVYYDRLIMMIGASS